MAELVIFESNKVDSSKLQLKSLNGRTYLAGPVVMAKEQVMNGILYPKDELSRGCPGWNGRPVTVGHPKKDGGYVSANSPDVLNEMQIGFIFDSNMDNDKMRAQLWLDVTKLDMFPAVRDAIANGVMLEVSTGLMLDRTEETGVFGNVEYKGKAINHLPDHLALLPGDVGACSIKDGAGFPRVNRTFAGNEVAFGERHRLIRNELQKVRSVYFYIIDLFEDSVVVSTEEKLFVYTYSINKETGTIALGSPIEVFQKIEYPPITQLGVNTMTEAEKKAKEDADAAVLKANADAEAKVKADAEAKAKADADLAANEAKIKADADAKVAELAAKPSPEVNEALEFLKEEKAKLVKEILANKTNTFTEVELNEMKFSQLRKIATLAIPTHANVDRSGMGGPGGVHTNGSVVDESPYIGA